MKDKYEKTAFYYALSNRQFKLAKLLLDYNFDINSPCEENKPAIVVFNNRSDNESLKFLLENNADPNIAFGSETPLWKACQNRNLQAVSLLLEYGANTDIVINGDNIIVNLATNSNTADCIKLLLDHGMDINFLNAKNNSALTYALIFDNFDTAKLLIEQGIDLSLPDQSYDTVLDRLKNHQYYEKLKPCIRLNKAKSALDKGEIDAVIKLIDAGLDCEMKDKNGFTFLIRSSYMNIMPLVRHLIAKGVNLDAQDNSGWTALMYAISNGNFEMVKLLVENGADLNITNNKNQSPLRIAFNYQRTEIAEYLLEKGATDQAIEKKNNNNDIEV